MTKKIQHFSFDYLIMPEKLIEYAIKKNKKTKTKRRIQVHAAAIIHYGSSLRESPLIK